VGGSHHFLNPKAPHGSPSGAIGANMKQEYPKWLYSKDGAVLVQDEASHKALEGEWFDNPADIGAEKPEAKPAKKTAKKG
jgi:hypothetical protein